MAMPKKYKTNHANIKKCFSFPQIRRGAGAGGRGVVWFGAPQATLSPSLTL